MIKVEITEQFHVVRQIDYPTLKMEPCSLLTVLFVSPNTGMVLRPGKSEYKTGTYCGDWHEGAFDRWDGVLEVRNDY